MSKFTSEMVDALAASLLIGLSVEENKQVLDEFEFIEANMDLITKIKDIDKVEPMCHPFDLYETTLREDIPEEGVPVEDLLRNAEKYEGREVEVPKVVG